jgi:hypothetical protein
MPWLDVVEIVEGYPSTTLHCCNNHSLLKLVVNHDAEYNIVSSRILFGGVKVLCGCCYNWFLWETNNFVWSNQLNYKSFYARSEKLLRKHITQVQE